MVLFYSVLHEKGKRTKNEDSLALHKMETRIGEVTMALVCDGMGGEEAGELASGYVAECLSTWFYDELPEALQKGFQKGRIQRSLQRRLFRIHEELHRYGAEHSLRCGTTMTLFLMVGSRYLLFQCGDSMAFEIRRRIKGLVHRQVAKRGLERCIGIGRFCSPHMSSGMAGRKSAFLLTSDGLLHHVQETDFKNVLSAKRIKDREDAEKALLALAAMAEKRGEGDNMSALYLQCG